MRGNNVKVQGFTLVEIAIVMVIFGLLMSMFGSVLVAYQKREKYEITRKRMAAIQKALDEFLEINGRYPCVAPFNRAPDQAGFGLEGDSDPSVNVTSCRFLIPGTIVYNPNVMGPPVGGSNNNQWVRVGSVPVRSLNLPDEYIMDAWGGRFTYAVSERQSSEDSSGVSYYQENAGAINVVDMNGNSVIDQKNQKFSGFSNFAEYVLISHGPDQKGARVLYDGTSRKVPCPAVGTETQALNCADATGPLKTNNPNYVVSDVIADGDYDDIVVYKAGTNFNEILPSGAVIGYNLSSTACPSGWRRFNEADGRFIMGATEVGSDAVRYRRGTSFSNVASPSNVNYPTVEATGEDPDRTVPPYVTTLFCEKQ